MIEFAYFVGGPRDGERVPPELLSYGPTIRVPLLSRDWRAYYTPESHIRPAIDWETDVAYREAPPVRVSDRYVFRFFFVGELDTLEAIADVLHRGARKGRGGGA